METFQLSMFGQRNVAVTITGYLCNPENYVFWPKKAILNVCGFYFCVALCAVRLSYIDINYANDIYFCNFSFTRIIA